MIGTTIVLLVTVLPWCSAVTDEISAIGGPENIEVALMKKITFNNAYNVPLGEIYGNVKLTKDNFKPGINVAKALLTDEISKMEIKRADFIPDYPPGGTYIDRKFSLPKLSTISAHYTDTPTAIARKLIENIEDPTRKLITPITLIIGDAKTGKTSALEKIRIVVAESKPSIWTVTIDCLSMARLHTDILSLTIDDIINKNIPRNFNNLFRNILELNPKNIIMMFDDIDKIVERNDRAAHITSLIKEFADKGTNVIATGRGYTKKLLEQQNLKYLTYEIPQMNMMEVENFVHSIWNKQINDGTTDEIISNIINERLNDYAAAFTHAITKIPFPYGPTSLLALIEVFEKDVVSVHGSESDILCVNYVHLNQQLSPMLLSNIESINIKKYDLYHEIVGNIETMNSPFVLYPIDELYGMIAMSEIVSNVKLSEIAEWGDIKDITIDATAALIANKESSYFINPIDNYHLEFINDEYKLYYAMRYLLSMLSHDSLDGLFGIYDEILLNPAYTDLMEYFDTCTHLLTDIQLSKILLRNHPLTQLLNNLIGNGYETTLLHFVDLLEGDRARKEFAIYFASQQTIEYGSKRILGIRSNLHDTVLPQRFGTPLELLVENNMYKVCKLLHHHKIVLGGNNEDWQRILRIAVSKPTPNLDFIQLLVNGIVPREFKINYADLMYHTMNEVGVGCRPTVEYLLSKGANPIAAVNNGRTLLHTAVQWNNDKLLYFVLYKLNIPAVDTVDDLGHSVLSTALDANPSPFHLATGWLKMMKILMLRLESFSIPTKTEIQNIHLNIPKQDLQSPWFKYILAAKTINAVDGNDVKHIKITPAKPSDATIEHFTKLARFMPPKSWDLSERTLRMRRELLFQELYREQSVISIIDILRSYKTALTTEELKQYESIIAMLSNDKRREIGSLPSKTIAAINDANVDTDNTHLRSFPQENRVVSLYDRLAYKTAPTMPIIADYTLKKSNKFTLCLASRLRARPASNTYCRFDWLNVDEFNDAPSNFRRSISHIDINTAKFLHSVARIELDNPVKSEQLLGLANEVTALKATPPSGPYRQLMQQVSLAGGLRNYRKYQRIFNIINNIAQPSLGTQMKLITRLPSRSIALFAAASLPMIRGIYGTITTCLQQHNDTSACTIGISVLVASTAAIPIGYYGVKYTPWLIERGTTTALELLPLKAPTVIKENMKLLRLQGLKYGGMTTALAIGVLGMGLDLYNIIQMSNMIDLCNRDDSDCVRKDKIDYIITLSFSCVSIVATAGLIISGAGFAAGILVGLAMLIIETFALGINDVIYYNDKYETSAVENFRIFFHKIAFQPPPADVQMLVRRTDWVQNLEQHAMQILKMSDLNIIAYGVGIGVIMDTGILPDSADINMNYASTENTRGLSRVLPTGSDGTIILCSPKQNKLQPYDNILKQINSSVYECKNSFVIANKEWKNVSNKKSFIYFDLTFVNNGTITGSNSINNIFAIYNSSKMLNIYGGGGNTSNIYMVQQNGFNGNIILNGQSRENVLDLKDLTSPIVELLYTNNVPSFYVRFSNNGKFNLRSNTELYDNLRIIGREGKQDMFNCSTNIVGCGTQTISVDGRGGKSIQNMDYINDCKSTVIRSFTHIIGSNNTELIYTTLLPLAHTVLIVDNNPALTTIRPQQSKFIVTFTNRPVFASTHNVKFIKSTKTLKWTLQYSMLTSLDLTIEPFRSQQENTTEVNIENINCVFIDSYNGITIYPEIPSATNDNDTINIREFNIFANTNKSHHIDIFNHYRHITIFTGDNFIVRTKLTNPNTGRSYIFGSSDDDNFYIDANTTFLHGSDGSDIYVLNSKSPKQIWIDNEATDNVLDTLIIPETTCDTLKAAVGSIESDFDSGSDSDVTLHCLKQTSNKLSSYINVILRNYLLESCYRHLQIYFHGNTYVLLPPVWLDGELRNDDNMNINFALFFSFGDNWQSTTLTITSNDTYVVLKDTDARNHLVAYRSKLRDVILAKQFIDNHSSSFVVLQDFFADQHSDFIAHDWLQTIIFIDDNSEDKRRMLRARDILELYIYEGQDSNVDFIEEYFVNMTKVEDEPVVIYHNNESIGHRNNRLGVLIITGAEPKDFEIKWNNTEQLLQLCAKQSCINVKNWCPIASHRLYQIEFVRSLIEEPIVIDGLNRLRCLKTNYSENSLIEKLYKKFFNAQQQLLLRNVDGDSDYSRLIKCVGSIFADLVAHKSMYKLFGFSSIGQQANFIHDNCKLLFNYEVLDGLLLQDVGRMVNNKIKEFYLLENKARYSDYDGSISLIINCLATLDQISWWNFKKSLYNYNSTSELPNLNRSPHVRCFEGKQIY